MAGNKRAKQPTNCDFKYQNKKPALAGLNNVLEPTYQRQVALKNSALPELCRPAPLRRGHRADTGK